MDRLSRWTYTGSGHPPRPCDGGPGYCRSNSGGRHTAAAADVDGLD
jgi:hypothetical protein